MARTVPSPPPVERLPAAQARRVALAAQGFTDPRLGARGGRVDRRHLRRVLDRVDLIQIDSVNVLVRSQELPLFARLGPHRRDLLPRAVDDGEVFEQWCHEASLLPVDHWPLLQWRLGRSMWSTTGSVAEDAAYVEGVYDEVADRGPLTSAELSDPGEKAPGMWGRSKGKRALEYLFAHGRLAARRRPGDFARVYDLAERVIPAWARELPVPDEDEAKRALLERAARACGVATDRCLADYHRLHLPSARPLLHDLVDDGRLVPVEVDGWGRDVYLHPDAHRPARVSARALLSPFDSLVWERRRTEELFGFRYRIEIYVRPAERVHGYYVLPFLLGDRLVARVDLKADRAADGGAGALLVQAAHGEAGIDERRVARELAAELGLLAGWLGLASVRVASSRAGDLAPALRDELAGGTADGLSG